MSWNSLPIWVRTSGRAVILLGDGEAADAKRRLLERAGATVVGEEADARLAVVAIEDEAEAVAAVERLKARDVLVNAVDRPELCDFTFPAVVDRAPVLVAIGTGGVSAGLAAALRQRLEAILPAHLGYLARALYDARHELRARMPDGARRRRAIADALAPGGAVDAFGTDPDVPFWLDQCFGERRERRIDYIRLRSSDPDELTLREARLLANADRITHRPDVPLAILSRARADAPRLETAEAGAGRAPGLTVDVGMLA